MNENIFKGWITSLVGIVIYVLTTILIYKGTMTFWPEGVVGYGIGTILLLAPKSIEGIITRYIDKKN